MISCGAFARFTPISSESVKILGAGEIGGKAKALSYLVDQLRNVHEGSLPLAVPPSRVIASDDYDELLQKADLGALSEYFDGTRVAKRFEEIPLAEEIVEDLRGFAGPSLPFIVRSSSLLEGTVRHSLAGMYQSVWLQPTRSWPERQRQLESAVRRVQASIWRDDVKKYRARRGIDLNDEKMAVLIQPVVGRAIGRRFYPLAAGVALSRNFYPWTSEIPEEASFVRMVYGLGTQAVGRQPSAVICPGYGLLSDMYRESNMGDYFTQDRFDYLDLEDGDVYSEPVAELMDEDAELNMVIPDLRASDPRLGRGESPADVTFAPLMSQGLLGRRGEGLEEAIRRIERVFGYEVLIEFALSRDSSSSLAFHVLQVRPLEAWSFSKKVELPKVDHDEILVSSRSALGNAEITGVEHVVQVLPGTLYRSLGHKLQRTLRQVNDELPEGYVLIGPGWWGTLQENRGIPVSYADISNAAAIVEVLDEGHLPPSFGGHLITNLIENRISLLSVSRKEGDFINLGWLDEAEDVSSFDDVRIVHIPRRLSVLVDGRSRRGMIYFAR